MDESYSPRTSLTPDDYKKLLANASQSTRRLNAGVEVGGAGGVAKLERCSQSQSVATPPAQKEIEGRFFVSVTDYRKRLLDEDNSCEKFHVDLCRYAGALPGDTPKAAHIETRQIQVGKSEPERVVIEVWELH